MECKVERVSGMEQLVLDNGIIKLVAVPEQGGRILEFSINDYNVLYRNPEFVGIKGNVNAEPKAENWPNVGGYKAWPAPQTKWGWPPIFDLDLGIFKYEIQNEENKMKVILTGPVSKKIGIQFIRSIELGRGCNYVMVKEEMKNCNTFDVNWALWDNTQVVSPGKAVMKLHSNTYYGGLTFYQDFKMPSERAYSIEQVKDGKVVTLNCNRDEKYKVGTVTDNTSIKYICKAYEKDIILTKEFQYEGESVYPHGSNIEVYNDNLLPYCELEILGHMSVIKPDSKISLEVKWTLDI